jgi:hypothetical protein
LQVLGFNAWGKGGMPWHATSQMEKDEDLQEMIQSTHFTHARWLKITWDVKHWDQKSTKTSQTQELTNVLDFHESRMIHGR